MEESCGTNRPPNLKQLDLNKKCELLVSYNDGKNVATAHTKVVAPTYGAYAVLLRTAKGATRYWARAAAQAGRRAAPGVTGDYGGGDGEGAHQQCQGARV